MKRYVSVTVAVVAVTCLATGRAEAIDVTTKAIADGKIDKAHACVKMGGSGTSPDLAISDLPVGTKFLAIVVDDPDAVAPAGKVWVHWNVVNIPADHVTIAAGKAPPGDELRGSSGGGYFGMCPPDGRHTYRFAVFALKDKIKTGGLFGPGELTVDRFEKKYSEIILDKVGIEGDFG